MIQKVQAAVVVGMLLHAQPVLAVDDHALHSNQPIMWFNPDDYDVRHMSASERATYEMQRHAAQVERHRQAMAVFTRLEKVANTGAEGRMVFASDIQH